MPSPPDLAGMLIAAIDRAGIGVTILAQRDGRDVRLYSSEALCALCGWSAEELVGMPAPALIAPAERGRLLGLRAAMFSGGAPQLQVDTVLLTRDGVEIPVELTVASLQGPEGQTAVLFFRDRRDDLRLQAALRDSEARFRSLAETSPDAITVIANGRLVYANPATATMLGFASVVELVARPIAELLWDPADVAELMLRFERIGRGERLPPMEFVARNTGGGVVMVEVSTTPIVYNDVQAFLSVGRDTSERRALQAELVRADRLATLGMLAAGVAHEINNPLACTVLALEELALTVPARIADPAAREEVEALIAEAREGSDRIRAIVREMLGVARQDEDARAIAVEGAIDSAIRLARPTIAARAQISRRGALASMVRASPARLSQVFLNLALNAADAFDAPGLCNRIVLDVSRSDDGAEVVITVSDNGRGIQPDLLGRIFEPLFTTKRADSGTGLGLWICRSIVADLGGTVSATSKVGVGTSMVVRLPAVASAPRL